MKISKKSYLCTFEGCKKALKKQQQLRIHQCQHSSARTTHKGAHEGHGKCFTSPSRLKLQGKVHREGCGGNCTAVLNLQSHILSFHKERLPFTCEHAGCGKTRAMGQSLTRHAVVCDSDEKKMKLK
ncbi:hypothetical protein GH733_009413 [Mirounga leonina]|nr:hypothetical protein GH733_009413 [Mirounga leonina]